MANVTINALYSKLLEVQREVHELREAMVPEVKTSARERKELDKILIEMKAGKEKNWREAFQK